MLRVEGGSEQVGDGLTRVDEAVRRLQAEWQRGRPDLRALWRGAGAGSPLSTLAELVKADLKQRFLRGESPEAAEYLDEFPELRAESDRVLSLIYEEYCLREDRGESPDAEEFCARYAPWRDSLETQLRFHRAMSQVAAPPPPSPPSYPNPGDPFERFVIGRELGQGGSARVYLARDESLGGRGVVLKVSADRGSEPSILGPLDHPHIVRVHAVVTDPRTGLRGLCMPYSPGLPLDEVIRRLKPDRRPRAARALLAALPNAPERSAERPGWAGFPARGTYAQGVAWVIATLADALAYAHGRRVFHRDVKPANVLLTYHDGPQLLDFNLSHDPHAADRAEAAVLGGTLPYMAPEQLRAFLEPAGWAHVGGAADVYSLGLLAGELLTGRPPEAPDTALPPRLAVRALLDRRAGLRPDLRRTGARVPYGLEAILARCLAYDPADRYADAAALAGDLRRFLARRPLRIARNPSRRERAFNWAYRNRLGLGAAAACIAAAAVGVRPAGRWLYPPETRPAFLAAVAALDGQRAAEAGRALARLAPDDRLSPVIGFYEAAALEQTGRVAEAIATYRRVTALPGAAARLSRWAKGHPPVAEEAVHMGGAFLAEPGLREKAADLAEGLFRLALDADPNSLKARQGFAVIDEGRGRLPSAHRRISALIAAQSDPAPGNAPTLRHLYHTRARINCRWGQIDLARLEPVALDAAVARLTEALDDIDRADARTPRDDRAGRFALSYIRCEALLALAEAADRRTEVTRALHYYREAERLIARLAPPPKGMDSLYRELAAKVDTRVREAVPRLTPVTWGDDVAPST